MTSDIRQLSHLQYLFNTLDPEQTGFIAVENFTSLAEHHELQLDPSKLEMLLALVQSNEHGHVCYQELIELIIVFMCYGVMLNKWVLQTYQPDFMKSPLVYHPGHRAQIWRFFSYMFMHVGLEQLGFNALLQLMIGVPLEMVHGILRISLLYMAGVVAGSLTVSITDMRAPVVGGSGGVYALCSAHLANVVMNWAGMKCPYKLLRMILALVCMSSEVGRAVWLRFSPPLPSSGPQPSFMAHLSGAVVGISMGLLILRSYEESLHKQCSWWVLIFSFITFLLFAIFWNIFAYELLGVQIPPPP
ncbi:rhomboid-related protein 1 isoform X4 [Chanodichthys erythropterus]|uniref:rhomboid-related protein 1 isoform X4 n=1 Tax=Chanodichthys erythropterus TaxID=933992 RepID=UPI00351EF02C